MMMSAWADYIVVEMAKHLLGADWMEKYVPQREQRRYRAHTALIGAGSGGFGGLSR